MGQGDVSGVTCVVSVHTHADVVLGEGKRQGGLWLPAGPEPEFPLWLGLISLPLTFLGDPCWFPPPPNSGLRATKERDTTGLEEEGARASSWGAPDGHTLGLSIDDIQ